MFFFFNETSTTEIYTLSLHDALPISRHGAARDARVARDGGREFPAERQRDGAAARGGCAHERHGGDERRARRTRARDRKSTRLNSSHANISYAVFCLKKKKNKKKETK